MKRALGIREDLFGGVVPFRSSPPRRSRIRFQAARHFDPAVGARRFRAYVKSYCPDLAHSRARTRAAARLLLASGPVRLKRGRSIGGRGQAVIEALDDPVFDTLDETELRTYGLVVEPNLADLTTFSVGQVCVGDLRLVLRHAEGDTITRVKLVRRLGSSRRARRLRRLERLDFPPQVRIAIEQAKAFDAAAQDEFDGLFASRRNYDVLRGRDASGRWLSGVLEQSWRSASAARAVRRSRLSPPSVMTRDCGSCTRARPNRTTRMRKRPTAPPCISAASIAARVRSPSTPSSNRMNVRIETVDIVVDEQRIEGTLTAPPAGAAN